MNTVLYNSTALKGPMIRHWDSLKMFCHGNIEKSIFITGTVHEYIRDILEKFLFPMSLFVKSLENSPFFTQDRSFIC